MTVETALRRARRALADLEEVAGSPVLVGTTEAGELLGIPKPHVTRLVNQGRMPPVVAHPGVGRLWLRAELGPLREELERERAARQAAAAAA